MHRHVLGRQDAGNVGGGLDLLESLQKIRTRAKKESFGEPCWLLERQSAISDQRAHLFQTVVEWQ